MELVFFVIAMCFAGIVLFMSMRRSKQRALLWQQVAAERGGMFHQAHGFLRRQTEAIEVDVGQVRVFLDLHVTQGNNNSKLYTRCQARYPLPAGPIFRIFPEGVLFTIGKALGMQDAVLGVNEVFDEHFIVRCDDAAEVRAVLSPEIMQTMLGVLSGGRLESDGVRVKLTVPGEPDTAARLGMLLDLVGAVAGADVFGLETLRTLPDASYHPPRGPWDQRSGPYAVVQRPVPVRLQPSLVGRRPVTRATVGDGPRSEPFKLIVRADGTTEPQGAAGRLSPTAAALLPRVGDGALVVDGADTSFTWLQVERDHQRLMAGVRLLATLAGGPAQGVFR